MKAENLAAPASIVAYAISHEMNSAIEQLEAALQLRKRVDETIGASALQKEQTEYEESLQEQAEAEIALVLAETKEHAIEAEKIVATLTKKVEKKHTSFEREKRLLEVLYQKAQAADSEIATTRSQLDVETSILLQSISEAFAAEVEAAAQPLIAVLKLGYALQAATPTTPLVTFLTDVKIPDVLDHTGRHCFIDGASVKIGAGYLSLSHTWQDNPTARQVFEQLSVIRKAKTKGASHVNFIHPTQRPTPYVRKGYTTHGIGT